MSIRSFSEADVDRDIDPADFAFQMCQRTLSTRGEWIAEATRLLAEDGWSKADLDLLFPGWVGDVDEDEGHRVEALAEYARDPSRLERLAMLQLRTVHRWTYEIIGVVFGRNRGRVQRLCVDSISKMRSRLLQPRLF